MRFVRHFLAASTVVGMVIALGFVWDHSSAASLVADGRSDRSPASASLTQAGQGRAAPARGRSDRRGANGMSLSNLDDLIQTLLIEGLILGGVVVVDTARRRHGRRPRTIPTT